MSEHLKKSIEEMFEKYSCPEKGRCLIDVGFICVYRGDKETPDIIEKSNHFKEHCLSNAVEELTYVAVELRSIPFSAYRYCACDLQKALLYYRMRKRPITIITKGETILAMNFLFDYKIHMDEQCDNCINWTCVSIWLIKDLVDFVKDKLKEFIDKGYIEDSFKQFPPIK